MPKQQPKYLDKTVKEWIKTLEQGDALLRRLAVYALGEMGPDAKDAIPALKKVLTSKDEESFVKVWAAAALAKIDPKNELIVPTLRDCMHDEEFGFVRSLAAWHAGRNRHLPGVLALQKDLENLIDSDPDQNVQAEAKIALLRMHGKTGSPLELTCMSRQPAFSS
ncbi:MAG: hypothetical protein KatS3mg105_2816 [Gemmatales bacterium]|nr:MAG: hypothetical protein KatS3mg105_2816 [Gemmatales bacterium]